MKILVNAAAAKMGGAANYIRHVAAQANSREGGPQLVFIVPAEHVDTIRALAPRAEVLPFDGDAGLLKRLWFDQITVRRMLRRRRIDFLFAAANFSMLLCPRRQLLLVRNSLYFSDRYRREILPSKDFRTRLMDHARRWLTILSSLSADVVMTPSQSMLDQLCSAVPSVRKKGTINHYGVDVARFTVATPPQASRKVRLLFSALYSEHKNVSTLFAALALLYNSGMQVELITPADPNWEPARNEIRDRDRIAATGLVGAGILKFTGVLGPGELTKLYAQADLFVYPCTIESFGHPLLEAMASGLPVIAADVAVNRELCGEAALYFSPYAPADCARLIQELADSADRRDKMAAMGRRRVENFQWSQHVDRLFSAMIRPLQR